jgi:hypothetical protein
LLDVRIRFGVPFIAILVSAACGPVATPACEDSGVSLVCDEGGAAPDYSELFATLLRPSCGRSGVSCHGEGSDAALLFIDEAESRAYLLEHFVTPGSAACSELYLRATSDDVFFRMPPAQPLSDAERCAIARWIESGAR